MEAILSSETSVNARSAQRHIPEDDIIQGLYHLEHNAVYSVASCYRLHVGFLFGLFFDR
jgi:hypothetical protein